MKMRRELYFGTFGNNLHVAWRFDMGATCESLGADIVQLDFFANGAPQFSFATSCQLYVHVGFVSGGRYSLVLRALDATASTVAISPPTPEVTIGPTSPAEFGTLTLTPCGASCP